MRVCVCVYECMTLNRKLQRTVLLRYGVLIVIVLPRVGRQRCYTLLYVRPFFFLPSENCFLDMKSLWWSLTGYLQNYSAAAIYTQTHTNILYLLHYILYKPHNTYYRRLQSQFPRLFFFSCNAGRNKNKENRGSAIIHDVRACAPTTFCTETAAVFNKISNNHNGRTAAGQI